MQRLEVSGAVRLIYRSLGVKRLIMYKNSYSFYAMLLTLVGTAVAQWLRCCATNRKVAGSIPDGVIGIFH